MIRLRHVAFVLALAAAAPAAARPMPPVETLARNSAERALMPRLGTLLSPEGSRDSAERLRAAEALLAELPDPTPLRGVVQMARSDFLQGVHRDDEAMAAALEAIRLLPGYSAPHVNAAMIEVYRDRPAEAVDHLSTAGAIDLDLIGRMTEYDVNALVRRLDQHEERQRLATLADLLARAGWSKAPDTGSRLALARIEARLASGDTLGAAALVGEVISPTSFSRLLTEKKFVPVRPRAVAIAGPRLEKLWPRYLALVQAQWQANAHERVRSVYEDALVAAGHDRSLTATFAPLFAARIDTADESLLFAAMPVARAYARLSQWDRGYDLLARVSAAYTPEDRTNRLNLAAARATLLEEQGRLDEAVAAFDALIADSLRSAGEVGEHNLVVMHSHRACLLEELGRSAEAAPSWRHLREHERADPAPLARALLCRDDLPGARAVLLAALEEEPTRAQALDMIQPDQRGPYPSDHSQRDRQRAERLRADPALRTAASRYADLLTERLNATAPPDPMLGMEKPTP